MDLWRAELTREHGAEWAAGVLRQAMAESDLSGAGVCAEVMARLRWGVGRRLDGEANDEVAGISQPPVRLTRSKLGHDIAQLDHLRSLGALNKGVDELIEAYRGVLDDLDGADADTPRELWPSARASIGDYYGRLLHVRTAPRIARPLSDAWDPVAVERQYLDNPPGVVVVDDVLSDECLGELRRFCLESTVWSGNRYAHGRLGAFFESGFNCPLLLQVAEEFRDALPGVIGRHHPLRQLWGFKSGPHLPADSTVHADFAAVNVNLWITPNEANLDRSSGGLVVYEVDAPLDWDFESYNNRLDLIQAYLRRRGARKRRIPYRENRALIFNSDLFHATDEVSFRSGYENLRVNITMLYGNRELDRQRIGSGDALPPTREVRPWRSVAFGRNRVASS